MAALPASVIGTAHGGGGGATRALVEGVFFRHFAGLGLQPDNDAALLPLAEPATLAVTTDGFVVDPPWFKGASLGELAVTGTCNDLAVMGAEPRWLTCAFILGTGTRSDAVERVAGEMARTATCLAVQLVAGDTKVVGHQGGSPYILVTTTGIGVVRSVEPWQASRVRAGDALILSGTIGEHTLAVLSARHGWLKHVSASSDCASLYPMLATLHSDPRVHWVRDVTRGGLSGVCNELARSTNLAIELYEKEIPVTEEVAGWCELLGYDPLTMANEGKALLAADSSAADDVLCVLRRHPLGSRAAVVGRVRTPNGKPRVILRTAVGGRRILAPPSGILFPRIC